MELATLCEAMERCLETRSNRRRLLIIRVTIRLSEENDSKKETTVPKSILLDFREIPLLALAKTNFHRSESLHDASQSLFEALTSSMTSRFRGEMRFYKDKTLNQGPKLLYLILRKLTQKDSRIVADLQLEIPSFEATFKEPWYDMNLVCPSVFERLQQYKCAGGNPETHYNVICTALISMYCDALTSAVREWEQAQMGKFSKKSIFDLLQKLPMLVDNLMADGTWLYKSSKNESTLSAVFQRAKSAATSAANQSSVTSTDLTAFKSEIEALIQTSSSKTASKALKAMIAHSKSTCANSSFITNTFTYLV